MVIESGCFLPARQHLDLPVHVAICSHIASWLYIYQEEHALDSTLLQLYNNGKYVSLWASVNI